jgi:hypothetical protein
MLRAAIELLGLYLLYKLIFDFIIPVAQTTKQVKKQFGDMSSQMKSKMDEFNSQQQNQQKQTTTVNTTAASKPKAEDYIEFEEVK